VECNVATTTVRGQAPERAARVGKLPTFTGTNARCRRGACRHLSAPIAILTIGAIAQVA
jgi:hypothetical protein